jgi:hypothetical protein
MNISKELNVNMRIKFCRPTGSAYSGKFSNDQYYLIPFPYAEKYKSNIMSSIRNGELFTVTNIETVNLKNRLIKISAIRKETGKLISFREEDLGYFVTI